MVKVSNNHHIRRKGVGRGKIRSNPKSARFRKGDLVKAIRPIYYDYASMSPSTLIKIGTKGKVVEAWANGDYVVLFDKHWWRAGGRDEFIKEGGKKSVLAGKYDLSLVMSQPIRSNEYIDDKGNIKRRVGPPGKSLGFGYYKKCPRCGGDVVDTKKYSQGYGSYSSSHVNQKCSNCGWTNHVVYD